MPRITRYLTLPFIRTLDGDLLAYPAMDMPDESKARQMASTMVGKSSPVARSVGPGFDAVTYVGAMALSRTVNRDAGGFEGAVVLARYGQTPANLNGYL